MIVENIGGAGGMNGAARVAKSTPDGSMFLFGNQGTHTFSQMLYKKPLYNAVADFAPVGVRGRERQVPGGRARTSPPTTLAEFIAYAKANQKKMQYGSAGIGSATHVTCVLLNHVIGVDITHVPYRGTGPAMQDMIAGRIDYMCEVTSTGAPHVRADAIKALAIAVADAQRALPERADRARAGPARISTPTAGTRSSSRAARPTRSCAGSRRRPATSLDMPDVRERLEKAGLNVAVPERRTPEYLGKLVVSELDKWGPPVRASGASAD